jgi:hypothetical protein
MEFAPARTAYEELNNEQSGTTYTHDAQKYGGTSFTVTRLVKGGIHSIATMEKEITDHTPTTAEGLPLKTSRIIKLDGGNAWVIDQFRAPVELTYHFKMHPYTRSIDWYTDDPFEGDVVATWPIEDVDTTLVPHRREVLIWRLEVPIWQEGSPLGEMGAVIDTINSIRQNWWFGNHNFSFGVHQVRLYAPAVELIRLTKTENRFTGTWVWDIREDGWYRQIHTTEGEFKRVQEYPAAGWPNQSFPDPEAPL